MKVFSPSATETFLQCPYMRHLRRTGLEPGTLGPKELAGILGTAFSAGVGAYNTLKQSGVQAPSQQQVLHCAGIARVTAEQALISADAAGMRTQERLVDYRARITERVQKAVVNYALNDPIPPTWERRDVELTMEEAGYCRPDLGCIAPLGAVVVDYKTKVQLEYPKTADLASKARIAAAEHQWREQRFHYSWFYGQRLQMPVYSFAICLVVLEPFHAELVHFVNTPDVLERWYQSRLMTWSRMEATDELALEDQEMAASHETKFGPCDYQRFCFGHRRDVAMATISGEYVVKERT